ncbi:hypothetical protein AVEN_245712-1 [Araneus ventricosus]|uniref:Uncharacterized protein n=1 Tax=Araneus ventricosus TaxID=182803 RepID=A0A4Y2FRB9_ARAVE|nr:hypothetical protein AVEN_245712-1 [Araneus ventricosus]
MPFRRSKYAAVGDSQRNCQNGYYAAEDTTGASMVSRKKRNCKSSKTFSPRVSKFQVRTPSSFGMSNYGVKVSLTHSINSPKTDGRPAPFLFP